MAINKFDGGVVLVSHDERLISLVADEIWSVDRYAPVPSDAPPAARSCHLVLVSHDERLVSLVTDEIWSVDRYEPVPSDASRRPQLSLSIG